MRRTVASFLVFIGVWKTSGAGVVTRALAKAPQLCMYVNADPVSGTVWAYTDFCNYDAEFFLSSINADGTIRFGEDKCLDAGDMMPGTNLTLEDCNSVVQQKWRFVSGVATSNPTQSYNAEVGQIMLADISAANSAQHTCMQARRDATILNPTMMPGTRIAMQPCDGGSDDQTWIVQPPPPENKTLLSMPFLVDVGASCLATTAGANANDDSYMLKPVDCRSDMAAKFWVRKGTQIVAAVDQSKCLTMQDLRFWQKLGPNIAVLKDCKDGTTGQHWTFDDASGALRVANGDGSKCLTRSPSLTVLGVGVGYAESFSMQKCDSSWEQIYAFGVEPSEPSVSALRSPTPTLAIYNAGECTDAPGWFDKQGSDCLGLYAAYAYCLIDGWAINNNTLAGWERRGHTAFTACCACQSPLYLGTIGGASRSGASLEVAPKSQEAYNKWDTLWTMENGVIISGGYCLDAVGSELQMSDCVDDGSQQWAYNRDTGAIQLVREKSKCIRLEGTSVMLDTCSEGMGWTVHYVASHASVELV